MHFHSLMAISAGNALLPATSLRLVFILKHDLSHHPLSPPQHPLVDLTALCMSPSQHLSLYLSSILYFQFILPSVSLSCNLGV